MLCTCSCACCAGGLRIGKLMVTDGVIEPVALNASLTHREYELLRAILDGFPAPVHAGRALYGDSPADTHAGIVFATKLRAKLKPWGVELLRVYRRGYTLREIT